MDSVEAGRACGSDTSHLGIFGYEPRVTYRGRGAFESLGAGCSMIPGDIAFKCNLAMMSDESGAVVHRRVDRTFDEEGPVLCDFLNGALRFALLFERFSELCLDRVDRTFDEEGPVLCDFLNGALRFALHFERFS